MAEQLEIGAHGITAILATWLGLIVLTRAGRQRGAQVFAFVTGLLVVWSVAIIIERLSTDPGVDVAFNAIEDVAAFLLPAATLHVALALTVEGRLSVTQRRTLIASYALCGAVALEAVFLPGAAARGVTPPHLEPFGIPGEILGWAWILARLLIFGAALYWIVAALRVAGDDVARQRQLQAALATVGSRRPGRASCASCRAFPNRTRGSACRWSRPPWCSPPTPSSCRASSCRPTRPVEPSRTRWWWASASPSSSACWARSSG